MGWKKMIKAVMQTTKIVLMATLAFGYFFMVHQTFSIALLNFQRLIS